MRLRSGERSVGALLTDLRKMQGHLARRDRAVVVDAVEAIYELGERLARAEGRLRGEPSMADPLTGDDLIITRVTEAADA